MKRKLTWRETVAITSMLFGMFFGAGNLIFPAKLGVDAGENLLPAYVGMFITAVGLPLLAVVALGMSRCDGVYDLSCRVGKPYGIFFSTLLYLTIGPLFAIPRCASVSFSVGAAKLFPQENQQLWLALFSFVFFVAVLLFSLKPNGIMTWIGRIINPIFLAFLAVLVGVILFTKVPTADGVIASAEGYAQGGKAFFNGFLEGYNTLDALAGLAFGIVVVNVVRERGISEPEHIASNTAKSGITSCLMMGIIYLLITLATARSRAVSAGAADGGAILGAAADHYFGSVGVFLLTAIVTFACLKTAIGLVTSCSEAFTKMFPKGPKYTVWAVIFCVVSFGIANFGLSTIVAYCVPVLMFLYPLAITLILLALSGKFFRNDRTVYVWTTGLTLIAAIVDFFRNLTPMLSDGSVTQALDTAANTVAKILPFSDIGLGWICPAVVGFLIGFILHLCTKNKEKNA